MRVVPAPLGLGLGRWWAWRPAVGPGQLIVWPGRVSGGVVPFSTTPAVPSPTPWPCRFIGVRRSGAGPVVLVVLLTGSPAGHTQALGEGNGVASEHRSGVGHQVVGDTTGIPAVHGGLGTDLVRPAQHV
jgi:hypothetical protein